MGGDLEIKLSRYNRVYQQGDMVQGEVTIVSRGGGMTHGGVVLKVDGAVSMSLSTNSVGLFEAFSSNIKPASLMIVSVELLKPGKLGDGVSTIPFSFPLQPTTPTRPLLDTYHGVYICIQYTLTIDVAKSGLFGQPLHESTEFIVEVPGKKAPAPTPQAITINNLNAKKSKGKLLDGQQFCVTAHIDTTTLSITKPLTGHVVVESTTHPIKSISTQLVRVETITATTENPTVREASEVQSIQAASGCVSTNVEIPLHMVLPRLFCAPGATFQTFQLEFELNLVLEFEGGYTAVQNWPLKVFR
mmetsp:Transcript_3977/g.7818  ORF Transcript_3977/g.7818 Transcript_3977/m.7818 type:complete len:302 (-) Transcript_3977:69-974(-)